MIYIVAVSKTLSFYLGFQNQRYRRLDDHGHGLEIFGTNGLHEILSVHIRLLTLGVKLSYVDDILYPDEGDDHAFEGDQAAQVVHLKAGTTSKRIRYIFLYGPYLEKLVRTIGGTAVAVIVQNGVGDEKEGVAYGDHVERGAPEIFGGQVELYVSFATGQFVPVFEVLVGKLKQETKL